MAPPSIVHVASEAFPLAKSGGLGDVLGALPAALTRIGASSAVFLPYYPWVSERVPAVRDLGVDLDVLTGCGTQRFRLFDTRLDNGLRVVLFRCDPLFARARIYDEHGSEYGDNAYRFGAFCKAALEAVKALEWRVDVFHLHDWPTALLPVFLRTHYEDDAALARARTVFTIHNLAYQGWADRRVLAELDLPDDLYRSELLECRGAVNLMKGGIVFADHVTTVSPRYAVEIRGETHGVGLDGVLATRAETLTGILNGIDPAVWDPAVDEHLPLRYDRSSWRRGKAAAREEIVREFAIDDADDAPLFGFIGRFTEQKGLDVLLDAVDRLVAAGGRLVMIGTGDAALVGRWEETARRHAGRVGVKILYDERLAHRIQAGVDALVMPSRYEPCGLNQLYAMRYGTVPIVHPVGGLRDTVVPLDETDDASTGDEPTGLWFEPLDADALGDAFERAASCFADRPRWSRLVEAGMAQDYTWARSARTYEALYSAIVRRRRHDPFATVPAHARGAATFDEENRRIVASFWRPYGELAIGLYPQGPTCLYGYWELTPTLIDRLGDEARLELYDLTSGATRSLPMNPPPTVGEYWFPADPDRVYQLAWIGRDARRTLVSALVRTPRAAPSDRWATDGDARWVTLEQLSRRDRERLVTRQRNLLHAIGRVERSSPYRDDDGGHRGERRR